MLYMWFGPPGLNCWIYFTPVFSCPYLCFISYLHLDLYVQVHDTSRSPSYGVYISQLIYLQEYVINTVIAAINFVKLFLNLITETQNWLLKTILI